MTDSMTAQFLNSLGLGKYLDSFAKQEIDYDSLLRLTGDDLTELGLPLEPRGKILDALEALRSNFSDDPWAPNPLALSASIAESIVFLHSSGDAQPYVPAGKRLVDFPVFPSDPWAVKPVGLDLSLGEDEEIVESIPVDDDFVISVPLDSPRPSHHSAPVLTRTPEPRSASPAKPFSAPAITRPESPAQLATASPNATSPRPNVLLKSELGRARADRDLLMSSTHRGDPATLARAAAKPSQPSPVSPRPELMTTSYRPDHQRPDHGRASLTRSRPTSLPVTSPSPDLTSQRPEHSREARASSPRPLPPQPDRATSPGNKGKPKGKTKSAGSGDTKAKSELSVASSTKGKPKPVEPKAKSELSLSPPRSPTLRRRPVSPLNLSSPLTSSQQRPSSPLTSSQQRPISPSRSGPGPEPDPLSRPPNLSLPRLQSVYHDVMPSPEADPEEPTDHNSNSSNWPPFSEFDY